MICAVPGLSAGNSLTAVDAHIMRIRCKQELNMPIAPGATATSMRKRAVNLTLSEGLVAQAKTYTRNLSATMEELLATYVAQQQQARRLRQQQADAAASDWNALHATVGSFADEHSTL
jgi:post-segregation antitoxin (ccd killing protein)